MNKSVAIITPTTGNKELIRCLDSVKNQSYGNITHHVVIDGKRFRDKIVELEQNIGSPIEDLYPKVKLLQLNDNTGANGFYGHRIYAGLPQLLNEDFIFLLDSDNTFEPDHVESAIKTFEEKEEAGFVYSLRNIYDKDNEFLEKDNCESLGKYPIWNSKEGDEQYLVDTSAYAFRRELLIQVSQLWHSGYAGDRRFYSAMRAYIIPHFCTGKYTMNYYLGSSETSPNPNFFVFGNAIMEDKYKGEYPWEGKIT